MSDLKTVIQDAVKQSMRNKEKDRLVTLRLITAAIKQKEVDERIDVDDAGILGILDKMVKQRRESISQFEKAGRDELAAKEKAEIEIISAFMPEPLSEDEINRLIADAISTTGATGMKDMGKVMGILQPELKGRADMGAVSGKIKAQLG